MSRGAGAVYRRGPVWWLRYWHHGKLYRESSRSARRADAVALLRKRHAELAQGLNAGAAADRVTFEDLAKLFTDDYAINERTSEPKYSLANLRAYFGQDRALDIPARVGAYIASRRAAGRKAGTIRTELALLKRMFSLGRQHGLLTTIPYMPSVSVSNARKGFFEEEEFEKVVKKLPAFVAAPVRFAYLTGWRRGEILSLTWQQIDFKAGVIRLEPGTTKNKEGRVFPFSSYPALKRLLLAQRGQSFAKVFPCSVSSLRRHWADACKLAGLEGKIVHDFRRTAARNMMRAGIAQAVIMRLMGHKTDAMFRRYAIVSEADLAQAVERLAR